MLIALIKDFMFNCRQDFNCRVKYNLEPLSHKKALTVCSNDMTFKEFYFRHNNCHYRGVGVKWSRVTVAGEMSHGDSTPTQGKKTNTLNGSVLPAHAKIH